MDKQTVKQLAMLQTGIYHKPVPNGEVLYLQAKHFDEKGRIRQQEKLVPELAMDKRVKKHLLRDKDLLLIAKGNHNQTGLYRSDWGPAVGSSVFFVIRLQREALIPEYVQWYLNTQHTQRKLAGYYKGTSIPSISKKTLGEMSIPVPSLAIQQNILDIHRLWEREEALLRELLQEKGLYYERQLMQLTSSQ